jgi:peroxiredoxin
MVEVYEKYKSKGLAIVGVSLDRGGWNQVKPFVQKMNIPYPVVMDDGKLVEQYGGIDAIPTTFIVDRKGNIVKKHIGYYSKESFEAQVKSLL